MEIRKLQRNLLKEEQRRRSRTSNRRRFLVGGTLLVLVLLFAGGGFYLYNLDRLLKNDFQKGQDLVARGKYQRAVGTYRAIHDRHPDHPLAPRALFEAGQVLDLYLKNYPEALFTFLLVEKDYPDSAQARQAQRQLAEIYKYRLRDYPEAVVAYQRILDGGVADGDRIQYEIADAYFRLGNFEQARIEFEGLLKNWPDSALASEVRYRIAATYALDGDLSAAEKAYRGFLQDRPDDPFAPEAAFGLAEVLEQKDELVAALKILEGLEGRYSSPEVLAKKIDQIKDRISKKKKAI
jgi:TolA-binding protein